MLVLGCTHMKLIIFCTGHTKDGRARGLIDNHVDGDLVSGSVGSPAVIHKVDVSGANTM